MGRWESSILWVIATKQDYMNLQHQNPQMQGGNKLSKGILCPPYMCLGIWVDIINAIFNVFFYFMCFSIFLHVYLPTPLCIHNIRFTRTAIIGACSLPHRCWELNSGISHGKAISALNPWDISTIPNRLLRHSDTHSLLRVLIPHIWSNSVLLHLRTHDVSVFKHLLNGNR